MSKLVPIPVGVSARHVHVTREVLDVLYGKGYRLRPMKDISQPGQFAAHETVELVTPKNKLKVRIIGPVRNYTQVELSLTDAIMLGLKPPIRESGDLKDSPGVTIVGPQGSVTIEEGVIIAARHIHMTPADAEKYGVTDGQVVRVKTRGTRPLTFDDVVMRAREDMALEMHIDTDEANAAGIKDGDIGEILL